MTPIRPDSAALARWPDVPACYGWLSLDRRGRWRLQDDLVTHPGLIAFLNAGYGHDDAGNWLVWNGPQRVYVTLDYLPWVFRLGADGDLTAHTGAPAGAPKEAYLDDEGNVVLVGTPGAGLLDDRDLAAFLADCVDRDGGPASEDALYEVMSGGVGVRWGDLPLTPLQRCTAARHFGVNPAPAA